MKSTPICIGIAGGTGSGKTRLAKNLAEAFGEGKVTIVDQDAYYHRLDHLNLAERAKVNFDHPSSIDFDLFTNHVKTLLANQPIAMPVYDFTTCTRRPETRSVLPHRVIIVEGILVLHNPDLRRLMDIKVFVSTPADIRFIRRLRRDVNKRGRLLQSVVDQYLASVRPMHEQFVEPSKEHADIIIPEGGKNSVAVDLLRTKINSFLEQK